MCTKRLTIDRGYVEIAARRPPLDGDTAEGKMIPPAGRAAPRHRRTIGQSATLTGRRAGRDLSLAPPPPGGGPGRAVIKHSHSSRPGRLHDDDDDDVLR